MSISPPKFKGAEARQLHPVPLHEGLEDAVQVCSHQQLDLTLVRGLVLLRDADDKLGSDHAGIGPAPAGCSEIER
jgi:hypothetical protein